MTASAEAESNKACARVAAQQKQRGYFPWSSSSVFHQHRACMNSHYGPQLLFSTARQLLSLSYYSKYLAMSTNKCLHWSSVKITERSHLHSQSENEGFCSIESAEVVPKSLPLLKDLFFLNFHFSKCDKVWGFCSLFLWGFFLVFFLLPCFALFFI